MRRHPLIYLAAAIAVSALLVVVLTLAVAGKRIGTSNTSVSDADVDSMDCEADDRAKREIPDCGRKVHGRYVEWSWVAKGPYPPPGWSPRHEPTASTTKPTPRTSTRAATSGGTNLLDGRSRRTTTNRNDSGGTRKNTGTGRKS